MRELLKRIAKYLFETTIGRVAIVTIIALSFMPDITGFIAGSLLIIIGAGLFYLMIEED